MTIHAWPYKSSEDLAAAGYKCRGPIACPLCGNEIVIYQLTGKMPIFLDPKTFIPHLADPDHEPAPVAAKIDGKTAATGEKE